MITLNGSSYTLPAAANPLIADGALTLSNASQTWSGSWSPITWTYDPASANVDFIPNGQNLVIDYGLQLSDGVNTSNTVRVKITIAGENDAPVIDDATISINEHATSGTTIYDTNESSTGMTQNIESESLTYTITAGNDDGIFSINSSNGEISIAT